MTHVFGRFCWVARCHFFMNLGAVLRIVMLASGQGRNSKVLAESTHGSKCNSDHLDPLFWVHIEWCLGGCTVQPHFDCMKENQNIFGLNQQSFGSYWSECHSILIGDILTIKALLNMAVIITCICRQKRQNIDGISTVQLQYNSSC